MDKQDQIEEDVSNIVDEIERAPKIKPKFHITLNEFLVLRDCLRSPLQYKGEAIDKMFNYTRAVRTCLYNDLVDRMNSIKIEMEI